MILFTEAIGHVGRDVNPLTGVRAKCQESLMLPTECCGRSPFR
jgi:hypothetical protein